MNSQQKFEDNKKLKTFEIKNASISKISLIDVKSAQEKHAESFADWLDKLEPITLRTYNFKTLYCHYKSIL